MKGSQAVSTRIPFWRCIALLPWGTWFAGCATLPDDPVERALYVDLRKGVELSEDTGWVVERAQLEENVENLMRSTCQVDPTRRDALDAWLGGQITLHGGPAREQYTKNGGDLSALSTVLALERTRSALRYAGAHATEDCPFWLMPDPAFTGVQGNADRFVLLLESQGFGAVVVEGDETAVGGGGAGRVLFGHGVSSIATLALGFEIGGTGAFVDNDEGSRRIDTTFTAAIPLLLRFTRFSRVLDFEIGPAARFDPGEDLPPIGGRAAVGVGLATMRSASFMPYGVLWVGYEVHPASGADPADHSVRIGTRVGVDIDP